MRIHRVLGTAALMAPLWLAACDPAPMVLSPQFVPPPQHITPAPPSPSGACRVFIGDVRDLRPDPQSMGDMGHRPVHEADSAGWVRSGLLTLGNDARIHIVDAAADADLVLGAEIVKAYVTTITTQKTANVVIRIHYSRHDAPGEEQLYRGALNEVNWVNGESETEGALDDALSQVLRAVAADASARCKAPS